MREKSWNCVKMSTNLYISNTYLPVKHKQHRLIREVFIRRCSAGAEKFHGLVKNSPNHLVYLKKNMIFYSIKLISLVITCIYNKYNIYS